MKRYTEGHGRVGAATLGLTRDVRVLPLTTQDEAAPEVEPLALFHSATANGYLGATGTTAGLVPTWYSQTLPCDVFGAPDADAARILLGSHLLRTFNVGYLIVGARDTATRALVETITHGVPRAFGSFWDVSDASTQYGGKVALFPPVAALLAIGAVAAIARPFPVSEIWTRRSSTDGTAPRWCRWAG